MFLILKLLKLQLLLFEIISIFFKYVGKFLHSTIDKIATFSSFNLPPIHRQPFALHFFSPLVFNLFLIAKLRSHLDLWSGCSIVEKLQVLPYSQGCTCGQLSRTHDCCSHSHRSHSAHRSRNRQGPGAHSAKLTSR